MNAASEIAIRWYLEHEDTPVDLAEDLIGTLYEGCGNNEADSIELRDRLLTMAEGTEKDNPWKAIVEIALALHFEMEGVEKALNNLEQIEKISKAVEEMPSNPLAKRITIMKVKECIGRLRA